MEYNHSSQDTAKCCSNSVIVVSGGDGYALVFFRTGTSAAELLAYLQMQPKKPDFVQIERELCLALSDPALSKKFKLQILYSLPVWN
ncbi:hypothetical protein [Nostoc commune]|uniref:hypothetical protein n=1 Tax=Nostoc commune TaxID=1178 RepID=UPI0018C53A09|nr:hypothetical protein [Nostoc commune]MBG1258396.1 hypothetical protein [Nostoc commune BAE]